MKRVMTALVIVLLSSVACQHPNLAQAGIPQLTQAAETVLPYLQDF
ncbi:MAG TPA: hypothetical protein VEC96_01480 [Anaerolineae bacterium]|nr:hypothetical protein [Anaerolineae bacterium]